MSYINRDQKSELYDYISEKMDPEQLSRFIDQFCPKNKEDRRLNPTQGDLIDIILRQAENSNLVLYRIILDLFEVMKYDQLMAEDKLREILKTRESNDGVASANKIFVLAPAMNEAADTRKTLEDFIEAANHDQDILADQTKVELRDCIDKNLLNSEDSLESFLAALASSRRIVECRYPGLRLQPELLAALLAATAVQTPYIRLYLPGCPEAFENGEGLDFKNGKYGLAGKLLKERARKVPGAGSTSPGIESATAIAADVGHCFDSQFLRDAKRNGLVICVGGGPLDGDQDERPRETDVASELLSELKLVRMRPRLHQVPLLSSRFAALLNRVGTSGTAGSVRKDDWKNEWARRLRQRGGRVASYDSIADFLARLTAGRDQMLAAGSGVEAPSPSLKRLVVVSTNVDMTLESAFIEKGLAFTSLVAPSAEGLGEYVEFPAASKTADGRAILAIDGDLYEEGEFKSGAEKYEDALKEWNRCSNLNQIEGRNSLAQKKYIRRWLRNELIRQVYGKARPVSKKFISGLQKPILIKILGSCHEKGKSEFVFSFDEFAGWSNPNFLKNVKAVLSESEILMIGHCLTDWDFFYLYEALLRDPTRKGGKPVALIQTVAKPIDAQGRIMRTLEQGDRLVAHAEGLDIKLMIVPSVAGALKTLGDVMVKRLETS